MVSIAAYVISIAIPAFAIYMIFVMDLFGTGKSNTVAICLFWGITGAFGLAYFVNTQIINVIGFETTSRWVAPFLEEIWKSLILLYFIQQPRFRYFVDGAVYGFAAGIGFAMSENIFYVANDASGAALSLAIGRVLSASLMHATASGMVGIALGLSRRASKLGRTRFVFQGFVFAIFGHLLYNNLLFLLEGGIPLLLAAVGIGMGGGIFIGVFIHRGLTAEKKRFAETLGIAEGVSSAERKAVQQLGSESVEAILEEMAVMFGQDNADLIRRLLVLQANMGILRNNLKSPVGDRLRKAWEIEVEELHTEMNEIRGELGAYIMTLLRSLLPEDDTANWAEFGSIVAEYDPNHVHSFDLFMVASELAHTISPEELERISGRLKKISIFKNVELTDLDNLSRSVTLRDYSHGEMLFDKGDTGDAMYMISRGFIDIFTVDSDGIESLLRTYQSGDVVGELALLDGQPRSARARANGPLKVMMLQQKHFSMFVQSRPKVILGVLQFLADRVRYTTDAVTGEIPQTLMKEIEEDTGPYEVAPQATDSIGSGDVASMGVFGRLSRALDAIELEDTEEDKS
jgi:CRP-like cAMP-binding protein/RsiW-degrading membrane proteinase PrsW (M82 family)